MSEMGYRVEYWAGSADGEVGEWRQALQDDGTQAIFDTELEADIWSQDQQDGGYRNTRVVNVSNLKSEEQENG